MWAGGVYKSPPSKKRPRGGGRAETLTLGVCCAGGGPTLSHNSLNLGLFLVPRLHGGFLVRADWSGPRAFGLLFQAHFPTPKPIDAIRPPILGYGRIGNLALWSLRSCCWVVIHSTTRWVRSRARLLNFGLNIT